MSPIDTLADSLITAPPDELAAQLAALAPTEGLPLIAALKQRVDSLKLRNARRALDVAGLAVTIAEGLADPAALGLARWARGNARYHLSRYHEALADYREAEAFYGGRGDDYAAACVQINQVAVLQDLGAFDEALAIAERARHACARIGGSADRLRAMLEMNSGAAYQQLARPAEALAAYERGRTLLVAMGDAVEIARIDINKANVLQEIGQFGVAAELYAAASAALEATGARQEVARAELNLGKLSYRRGRYQEALRSLETARSGFAAIPDPIGVAKVDLYRAFVYRELNLLDETVALAGAAGEVFARERTRWEQAAALMVAGGGLARRGDPDRAETLLTRARRLLQRQGATGRVPALDLDRAALALAVGHVTTARRLARRVSRQIDPETWPSLAARADLLLAGAALASVPPDPVAARVSAQAALSRAARYDLPERADAEHALARALAATHDGAGAAAAARRALAAAEALRQRLPVDDIQLAYLEERRAIYRDAARYALLQSDPAVALATLDIAFSAPVPRPPAMDSEIDSERLAALRERWAWLQSQLEVLDERRGSDEEAARRALDQERRTTEAALADIALRRAIHADPAALDSSVPTDPFDSSVAAAAVRAIQARLGPGEALLVYAAFGNGLDAIVVCPNAIERRSGLADGAALQRLLRSWRFHIEHSYAVSADAAAYSAARSHLSRFYTMLLAKLEPLIDGVERLFVVLPPEWHDLPLAAAYDGRAHVVERLELIYLSAPGALASADAWANNATLRGPALVVGCSDDRRLPETLVEASSVAAALRLRGPVQLLLEDQARLSAVRVALPHSGLIHLASHAAYRPDNPRFSWVRLADGELTVADVGAMRLAGRPLVVLSACETGRGRPFGGGLAGMGRALLLAGASALVVSLWKIADRSSSALMSDFYAHLTAGPGAALARAQRQAIARGEHPFHWAAFLCLEG